MNPKLKKHFKLIVDAVTYSENKLKPFRGQRTELIKVSVGSGYGGVADEEAKRWYIDLIDIATRIFVRQLAVRAPTAKITTPYRELRPIAANFTLACENAAEECNLGLVLRRAAVEALYSPMAVVKIGLEYAGKGNYLGNEVDYTDPFVRNVSFDDYFRDMTARSANEPYFEGDTYVLTEDQYKARYGKKIDDADKGVGRTVEKRAEDMGHSPIGGDEETPVKIMLKDVWFPRERTLVTYKANNPGEYPLDVVEDFDTAEEGPYRSLWFNSVPDNAMPLPPFGAVKEMHMLANSLLTRLAYQSENKKAVAAFENYEDAKTFTNAKDGHGIHYKGRPPEAIVAGGIDPTIEALFIQVKNMFSWAVGNLDIMGGLSPMSETATQDKLLAGQASAQLADMQDAISAFAKSIFKQIAWYEWTDPVRERRLHKQVPGTDIFISVPWNPDTRQGDFPDLNFDIVPQSMREEAPGAKINKIYSILNNAIMPFMPFFQQQGYTIDARRLMEFISDYSNVPELADIMVAMSPEMMERANSPQGNPSPGTTKPAATHRTYERINRPGATRGGQDSALQSLLMGGNVQPAEKEAIGRSVS